MLIDLKKATNKTAPAPEPSTLAPNESNGRKQLDQIMSVFLFCLAAAALTSLALLGRQDIAFQTSAPFLLGFFPACFRIDRLSVIFISLLSIILIAVALFSPGYLGHIKERVQGGQYWTGLFLFVLSMYGVVLSADAMTFIVLWEIMSLSSAALVASDHNRQSVRKSAFIYLGATRIASAFLAGGFLCMHSIYGSWQFSDWSFASENSYIPACLILIAFCIKAGIWPFHIWLPYAHPAAPATVSALMSGFMIKIALYGIIRILVCGGLNSVNVANFAFVLGAVSSFWGVLFALVQNDLKRLLAYSSIENVGLILIAIALSMKARIANLPEVSVLALTAAIFHCLNHGLFKTLLFLSAGAVDSQAHTRDLRKLGGLAKRLPWTMICFFTGSFAICSLPPLNGFASKWLIYQSLFQNAWQSGSVFDRGLSFFGLCLLSIVGGLAIAAFAKAMGVSFLGMPRCKATVNAKEASIGMIVAQALLAIICIGLGVSVNLVLPAIAETAGIVSGLNTASLSLDANSLFPIPAAIVALLLVSLSSLIYLLFLKSSSVRKYSTWDCGFGPLSAKTQVSSDSFAQPVARIFRPLLRYENDVEISGQDRRHFPEHVRVETKMVSILESRIYLPSLAVISSSSKYLVRLQAGSIHLYLLYLCLTLIVLLVVGTNL